MVICLDRGADCLHMVQLLPLPCNNSVVFCGLTQSPSCDCGQRQTTNHIVDTCPLTQYEGGLNLLHEADDDAVMWLESTANCCTREINSDLQYLV